MSKVVKLAQPGFDVKTAGDENLIYNSNWPLLKIYQQGQFTAPTNADSPVLATHDLGFIPMCWFFSNLPISNYNTFAATAADERAEYFGPGFAVPQIYDNRIIVPNEFFKHYQSFYYYIFALDLTKQFTAPIVKTGGVGGKSRKVFKIAKPNKDIFSSRLEDYVVHSQARSPLIHSVNPGVVNENIGAAGYAFTVYHNLGYNPMFFGYTKNADGSYRQINTGSSGSTIFRADEQKIRWQEAPSGRELTIVVLKDPFLVDYSVQVNI